MCVKKVMVYGSETCRVRAEEMRKMKRTEIMMTRWMSRVILKDRCKSEELRKCLEIEDVADICCKTLNFREH